MQFGDESGEVVGFGQLGFEPVEFFQHRYAFGDTKDAVLVGELDVANFAVGQLKHDAQ